MKRRLCAATTNAHKLVELRELLLDLGIEVLSAADVGGLPEVEEDQDTLEENASKKARSAARATGLWSLADDSGLSVDALDGAPGVHSARFAGPGADDDANNALLLERLSDLPDEERGARFVCCLALARPDGEIAAEVRGEVQGRMLRERRGDSGFGYDPYFLFTEAGHPGAGKTFAELSRSEKSRVSHRGRALAALADRLAALIAAGSLGPGLEAGLEERAPIE